MHTQHLLQKQAIVLFSGGQDSTSCLAWALNRFEKVHTLAFDYGQKHTVELECRKSIRDAFTHINSTWQKRLGQDILLEISLFEQLGSSTLLASKSEAKNELNATQSELPSSFVPGRNLFFLTSAAALAYKMNIEHIITGVSETDYSGYPDCRDQTMKALELALSLGMEKHFVIHSPLMWLSKGETWQLAQNEGGQTLVECIRTESHTCYSGDRSELHAWGYGCGKCPACILRAQGYEDYLKENTNAFSSL